MLSQTYRINDKNSVTTKYKMATDLPLLSFLHVIIYWQPAKSILDKFIRTEDTFHTA